MIPLAGPFSLTNCTIGDSKREGCESVGVVGCGGVRGLPSTAKS